LFLFRFPLQHWQYMKQLLLIILFNLFSSLIFAQTAVEKLKTLAKTATESHKIDIYNQLSELYRNIDADSSIIFAENAIKIAEKKGTDLQNATAYLNLGITHRNRGNSKKALEYFLNALLLADKMNNKHLQADILHKVGVTHLFVKEFKEAISFAKREEAIWQELKDEKGLSAALNLSGLAHSNLKEYDIAERKFFAALEIGEKNQDPELIYKPLVNLGDLYYKMGDSKKAILYIERSRQISEKTGNKVGIAAAAMNMAKAYMLEKNYEKAILSQEQATKIATEIQSLPLIRNGYGLASQAYELAGKHDKALKYHKLYKTIEDSLADRNSRQNITALEAKYAGEKQRQQILLITAQEQAKQLQVYILAGGIFLIIIALMLLINRYLLKNKYNQQLIAANLQLQNQAQQIEKQHDLIQAINVNMVDSINAAKHIQRALLPTQVAELAMFSDYFIINLPRNIVSGDFCWFEKVKTAGREKLFFDVGDCTGHGVPAAFLTLLSNDLLTDIVKEFSDKSPSFILTQLHERINKLFAKQEYSNEGLDIGLCSYYPDNQQLTYSGAKIPLYYFQQGTLFMLKASRTPIGDVSVSEANYQDQTVQLYKNTTLYMASDGYQDQFGGTRNRKFMANQLRELLVLAQAGDMTTQRRQLVREKNLWQGESEQTDDIFVMGIKI
jgi:serine phosphatase RsbU (regulator of sigma subunit)